ncbi:octopamine receptor beta-2R isoform X1 [Lepeophtheirus salmonis]|uniref:octopamine receptor beta-2R isoform X1 n=1 Tax=Lepeophtheirus salmonis TaxID=72036 RepID=UPI001AEAC5A0|nr:octopamine receptor beta-2R-like isoform X1 [Lepeophtheirus salmonis]
MYGLIVILTFIASIKLTISDSVTQSINIISSIKPLTELNDSIRDPNSVIRNNSSLAYNTVYESDTEGSPDDESLDTLFLVLKSGILILIIILAIFNNLLVVISVFRYHRLRHINNYFLVSLAVADLLVACFAMTFNALVEITGEWNFGYIICDLWNSLDVHFSTVSTLHLCCISVDRYFAIVKPLKYTSYMTVKVAAVMIGVAWTAPTLISFLPIFLGWYTTKEHLEWRKQNPDECIFKVNQPYAFISSALTFWAPVAIMLCMYHRIYKEALRQKESIRRSSVPSQQHLIIDSDRVRTRFNELQANGFKSGTDSSGNITLHEIHSNNNYNRYPPNRLGVPASTSSYRISPSTEDESLPLNVSSSTKKETKFVEGNFSMTLSRCASPTPSRNCSLTPPASNNLLSVINAKARRVSMAHSINSDDSTTSSKVLCNRKNRIELSEKMTSIFEGEIASPLGVWTIGQGVLERRLKERNRNYSSWRKEHKAFVTLGIVMGAFLLCWVPFFTWYLTVAICGDEQCPCPRIVVSILFWIGYFNSTLNPVIYVMTNRDFKDAFSDILRKTFCWFRSRNEHSQKEWRIRIFQSDNTPKKVKVNWSFNLKKK